MPLHLLARVPRLIGSRWITSRQQHSSSDRFHVLFMGRDEFSCIILKELFTAQDVWQSLTVATHPDTHLVRRGAPLAVAPLKLLSNSLNVPLFTIPTEKGDFKHWKLPDPFSDPQGLLTPKNHILITASFGRILSKAHLSHFHPKHRLNVHPSLLPAYRGPAPIQHTLINGEKKTGVCVIGMLPRKEGIDSGPIYGCSEMEVSSGISFAPLRDSLAFEGGKILVSVLRDILNGTATCINQPPTSSSHAPMIKIADSVVNFSTMTATNIVQRDLAISHQRPLMTHISSHKNSSLQLHDLSVFEQSDMPTSVSSIPGHTIFHKPTKGLLVRCANNTILAVRSVKPENKKKLDVVSWWNGLRGIGLVKQGELQLGTQTTP